MGNGHEDLSQVDVIDPIDGVCITGNTAREVMADAAAWCARHSDELEVLDVAWRIGGYESVGHPVKYQLRVYYRPQ